jgi:predicted AlkP superfamily phosphohydrolase/phosphomutase
MKTRLLSALHLKRRRGFARLALLLCCAMLILGLASFMPTGAQSRTNQEAKRILVISLDGLDWRYVWSAQSGLLRIPTLRRLMADGISSSVMTVYPSVTYPAHTSIVTGAYPSRHGIYSNEIFDTSQLQNRDWNWFARAIRVETLWDAASKKRLTTAMVSWPVATGEGDYNVPEILKIGGTFPETLALIKANARPQGLVEEVERADPQLYRQVSKDESDDMRTRFAEYLIEHKRPQVMFVHLFDLDHIEHKAGPFTPEARAILEKTDAYVARILASAERAGTLSETAVFIVSDHGFLPITKQIHPGVLLAEAGLLKVLEERDAQGKTRLVATEWRALPFSAGGSCAIILHDPLDIAALNRVRALFDNPEIKGQGLLSVLDAAQVRAQHGDPRAALVLEAGDGYRFGNNYSGELVTPDTEHGAHGYLPSRYLNTFIASGAGIQRRGTLDKGRPVRLIDLGPTIGRVLKLKLDGAEGRAWSLR